MTSHNGPPALPFDEAQGWRDSARADAVAWHRDTLGRMGPQAATAYEAAYNQAWKDAMASLVLHGYLTIDHKPANPRR